ncbi:MAG: hypothetical protein F7C08_00690 [Desulfurococcales archaeon]|nr:hypothetical protein [Desulfurococcales archaeon]MCE4605040.1 hypothetical protein [Desulfurococcales archaeon]
MEVAEGLHQRLGLDYIGVNVEELAGILEPVIEELVEARSTRPKADAIVNRLERGKQLLLKAIAANLLDREELTPEQVEFIVANAEELAGRAAPKLYRQAERHGLEHLVDALRYLWERYGNPLPVRCPRCRFSSLTPDLECIVCGARVGEEELKRSIGFKDMLLEYARTADHGILREILAAGFVVLDGELKPPSLRPASGYSIVIYLNREEREEVGKLLSEPKPPA